ERGGVLAGGVARGDLLGALYRAGRELLGELGERRPRGLERLAAGGERLLPCGQAGLELGEGGEGACGGGGLVGGGGEVLVGLLPLEQVHQVAVLRRGGARALGEGLDRGGDLCRGGVAAAQDVEDGPRGLVALQRGAGRLERGPLLL